MTTTTCFRRLVLAAALLGAALQGAQAAPKKYLVLDKITYQKGVDQTAFEGIDELLKTKFTQSKYELLDRENYDTSAREEALGAKVDLVPAGYSIRGEIVQLLRSGKTRTIQNTPLAEYIATISLRVNDLRTQQPYEAETLRVVRYCQTPKDMLVYVVQRVAFAILMRDYPMYLMDAEDPEDLTLSYGADFLNKGERYEIRRRRPLVDNDTGKKVFKEKTVGVCEVVDVGKNTSTARLLSGKAKVGDVLRFYENAEPFAVPAPAAPAPVAAPAPTAEVSAPAASVYPVKKPRIVVAPFCSKCQAVNVFGVTLPTRTWMDDVADHLNTLLTQTGSFRVLDRSFGPERDRELNRIVNDPNASPNDVCRLSNKLTTDYLVVAEVMFSSVASPGVDFVTGLPLPPPSVVFAEVRFRCVMAPTTEIAWSDTVKINAAQFAGLTAPVFSSTSGAAAAQAIADAIQRRLAPADFARVQAARAAAAAEAAKNPAPPPPSLPVAQPVNAGF